MEIKKPSLATILENRSISNLPFRFVHNGIDVLNWEFYEIQRAV